MDADALRRAASWWRTRPAEVAALEGASLREDRTIRRLRADELERNADLRTILDQYGIAAADLLAYVAYADGPFGRYRVAAVFILPPAVFPPAVYCLDGPRGASASVHRNGETELCLFYRGDPDERRWTPADGLRRLFDLARRHLVGEHIAREQGSWPIEEAPHGETEPARPDPRLALPPLRRPGRNEPCSCGSGLKAKRCCWR